MADNFDKTALATLISTGDDLDNILKDSMGRLLRDYDPTVKYTAGDIIYHKSTNGFQFMRAKIDIPKGACTNQTQLGEKFEVVPIKNAIPGIPLLSDDMLAKIKGLLNSGIGKTDDAEFFRRLKSLLDGYIGDFDREKDYKKGDAIYRKIGGEYKFLKAIENIAKGRDFNQAQWKEIKGSNPLLGGGTGGSGEKTNAIYAKKFLNKQEAINALREGRSFDISTLNGEFYNVYVKRCRNMAEVKAAFDRGPIPLSDIDGSFIKPEAILKEGE